MNVSIYIFRHHNAIANKQGYYSINAQRNQPAPPLAKSRMINNVIETTTRTSEPTNVINPTKL